MKQKINCSKWEKGFRWIRCLIKELGKPNSRRERYKKIKKISWHHKHKYKSKQIHQWSGTTKLFTKNLVPLQAWDLQFEEGNSSSGEENELVSYIQNMRGADTSKKKC